MTKVLVTGGLGFIGRGISEELRARGFDVRILDNQLRGAQEHLRGAASDFDIILGDIRDPDLVRRAVEGCEEVYHLAAINGTKNFYEIPRQVLEVGIIGTHVLLDAAIRSNVPRFLFMSSSEVYQTPASVPTDESASLLLPDSLNARYSYGGSKIAGELMTINYGRDAFERAVIVRPHNVYGPNMGFDHVIPELAMKIMRARRAQTSGIVEAPLQGDGSATRAFVYIDDFVDGALRAMTAGDHLSIYHVGAEEEIAIIRLAELIAETLGVEARFTPSAAPSGQTQRRCPDISRIRALGYAPQTSLRDGLRLALGSVRAHFERSTAA
ncbi:MAG: NAD-dependent epimerase/dehydratase family protein [Pseudomonadota bacterium]